jgi:autoinducer 2 (AI-2) kinase
VTPECVVALDAGTGSGRTAIFDLEGRLLGLAAEGWTFRVPEDEPMGSEFDPAQVWATLARTTHRALSQAGVSPAAVRAVSATSQRDGVVFLDGQGRELYCGTNRDARGVLHAEEVAEPFGEQVCRVTGRWPLGLGALGRLWWFRQHRPETYERVARLLMISDWLIYRLCGEFRSEPTNSSSSLLFDIQRHEWSAELAETLGFSPDIFPACVSPGAVAGALRASAAADLGLPTGIPVVMGAGDSQAAGLGCAAFDDGATFAVAGTTLPLQMVLAEPVLDPRHRLQTGAYLFPDRWVLESNGGLAGAIYRWFAETFAGGDPDYDRLEQEAAAAPAGQVLAVLGPQVADFSCLRFPPPSLFRFPFLSGIEEPVTRGAFARSILESVAYAVRGNLEQIIAVSGRPAPTIHLCGGLARSGLLVQIVADVCERTVRVPVVREASCLGAAVCAAVGAGVFPTLQAAAQAMVRWESPAEPSPTARRYRRLYSQWRKLLDRACDL